MLKGQPQRRAQCTASALMTRRSACSGCPRMEGGLAGLCDLSSSSLVMTAARCNLSCPINAFLLPHSPRETVLKPCELPRRSRFPHFLQNQPYFYRAAGSRIGMCCAGWCLRALYVLVLGRSKYAPRRSSALGKCSTGVSLLHQLSVGSDHLQQEVKMDRCVTIFPHVSRL